MKLAIPPSILLRHFVYVALFNAVVASVLLVAGESRWDVQLVYSQAIGLSIWALIETGRVTLFPDPETKWPRGYWGALLVVLGIAGGYIIGTLIGDKYCGCNTWSMTGMDHHGIVTSLVATVAAGTIGTAYFYWRGRSHYFMAKSAATAQALSEAKLKLLESQLEPHMLFNTLANLRVLIALDPDKAQAMLDRLIAFLRATLAGSRGSAHSLADEFARIDDYLELMKVRMGERLRTRLTLPESLALLQVPPLLLQPLVENAIKHGLEPHVEGGLIDVSALVDGDTLVIKVRDTGTGLSATSLRGDDADADTGTQEDERRHGRTGSHFGLVQVRERLATLYSGAASLTLEAAPPATADGEEAGGTLATVRVPAAACAADVGQAPSARAAGRITRALACQADVETADRAADRAADQATRKAAENRPAGVAR